MLKSFKIFRLLSLSSTNMPFYAVIGPKAGIFNTWDEAKECTNGVSRSRCKKFNTLKEAENYLADNNHEFYENSTDPAERISENRLASKILSNSDCDFSKPVAVKKKFESKDPEHRYYDDIAKKLESLNRRRREKEKEKEIAKVAQLDESHSKSKRSRSPSASLNCVNANKTKKRRIVVEEISASDSDDDLPVADSKKVNPLSKNQSKANEIISLSDSDSEPVLQNSDTNGDLWGDDNIFEAVPEHLLMADGASQSSSSKHEGAVSGHSRSGSSFMYNSKGFVMVFTDGACSNNGYKGAQAGIGVWFNHNHPLNLSEPVQGSATNNNAEIQAATRAMQQASKAGVTKLDINTDSQFLIQCMTQWIHTWKKNGWKLSSGKPVKNKEKLEELDKVLKSVASVSWTYVQSHVGIEGNEAADLLARLGAQMYQVDSSNRKR